jgi:BirA family transcriptional regulator, biotin operon repressor / biotin---[acetyl-CoA-carboxylase] ligase
VLRIVSLERVDSTQRYLIDGLKAGTLVPPVAVTAAEQYAGRGSRENRWSGLEGNLFLSFALERRSLPEDLKLESASIYFAYLLKEALAEAGSKLWLKWPNDFYIDDQKIGGTITNLVGENLVCGIGVNLRAAPEGFGTLDIDIKQNLLLLSYFEKIEKSVAWKQIFSKYQLEFAKCRAFYTHAGSEKVLMKDAVLLEDGAIESHGQRIYSIR